MKLLEETGVPGENHRLTPSHWQLSHWDLNSGTGERQLVVSGNALDHTAIRAGPFNGDDQSDPVFKTNLQIHSLHYIVCLLTVLRIVL